MDSGFNFHMPIEYRIQQLKKDVIHVLKKHPEGLLKSDIWPLVSRETGRNVRADMYGLTKMSRVFERWTDDITIIDLDNPRLVLKDKLLYDIGSLPAPSEPVPVGLMAEIQHRAQKTGKKFPSASASGTTSHDAIDVDDGERKLPKAYEADVEIIDESEAVGSVGELLQHLSVIKEWIINRFHNKEISSCKMNELRYHLKRRMKEELGILLFKKFTCKKLLEEYCTDIVYLSETKRHIIVNLIQINEDETEIKDPQPKPVVETKDPQLATAMSLLTKMSNMNKNPTQGANFISLLDEDKKNKKVDVIDLTNESGPSKPQKSTGTSKFGSFPVPSNLFKPLQGGGAMPVKLGKCTETVQLKFDAGITNAATNPLSEYAWDIAQEGFQNRVIEIISNPINTTKFRTKRIDARQEHVPYGRLPAKEHVDGVAQECIDMLAEANENVTMERVEKLVCQRFGCHNVRQIGFQYPDQIPCINELNRLLCKINLNIIAFVKSRSICTLHELKESLREYAPGKGEFESLKFGPLQRFPLVYQQFSFPPDMEEIPEVTTMDILYHFHNYLTKLNLWSKKLDLDPFMEYLAREYEVNSFYMIGCKIRSLPLAAAVLKKAKRDSSGSNRQFVQGFKDELKNQMGEAFRKFRASIMVSGEGDGMELRKHYMKMRPELAILEIFDKFNILLMVTQSGNRKWTRNARFRHLIEEFLTTMRSDGLCRDLLHLCICLSNTQVAEAATALLVPQDDDSDGENDSEGKSRNKPPPRKDALIESARTYIERCLNAGAISLTHLDRIEEKMLEDFGFASFNMMGYGRFIEFLLLEVKQLLEEGGGLSLGTGTGGEADFTFKPELTDLLDFIKQCRQCGQTEPDQMKEALCNHYNVKEVRHLGYGNITRLLSYADKHGRHTHGECSVYYESTLVKSTGHHTSMGSKVGILGHQTRDAAKTCLHNCPLLENLADWSQWSLVFEPELGKLKDFIQKHGGVTTKTIEGGKLATFDFLALESKPGDYLKIVSSTSPDHVATALGQRNAVEAAGHLVSMTVAYKGVENMPVALLSGHVKTALLQMHSDDSTNDTSLGQSESSDQLKAVRFVLQCLLAIPTKICVALANQVFLDPLGHVVGSSKSKQLLAQLSKTGSEQNRLVQLGCLLGIPEWTDMIQQKCQLPVSAIQILPPDAEELLGDVTLEVEDDEDEVEMYKEDGEEDVDEILAGDLGKDKKAGIKAEVNGEIKTKGDKTVDVKEEMDEGMETEDVKSKQCEDIVNQIRRDEFGVGVYLSEDGQRLMKIQQERLGRSLERLSKDLYSKDTHFVLELVQNADDNNYHDNLLSNATDECPSVKFVIEHDGIYVMNNELGFAERDIRALCDVGRSTKGKHKFGYIGQKGIGFKSVFRITDAPEVHSNGYHIKFDVNSGPMGYILPHWIPDQERLKPDEWMTHIKLGLKPDMKAQTRTLAARFNDIHPSLLLFLHRLREITIENKVENSTQMMRRRDVGDNVVEIQHTHGSERWLVFKKMLDASKISLQAKSGADVESTELALAFPLKQQAEQNIQTMPAKQPVFAFLPLRSYGFRFIIQGDFDVPSSREDVDRDSSWNQWLRNEIHTAFVDALDVFKSHGEFNSIEAVCRFLQFVPMEDEVLDFFKPVASDILKKLRAKPCVPTQPNDQGVISWKIPSQTVITRDPLVRNVITSELLQTHLNLYYLNGDVASILNPSLSSCLGIATLTSDHLFQLGKALVVNMGTKCRNDKDIVLISKWMACLYRSLDEFHQEDTILNTLKSFCIMPMASGELIALKDKTVFYPAEENDPKNKRHSKTLSLIHKDVNSIHPMLLKTGDDEVNSQVHKLLSRLLIKQLTPFDVINNHILPVLKSDAAQTKSKDTLVAYLAYIKEQSEKQASICNLDDLKDVAMVLTNQGIKIPAKEPVHFPPKYGNTVKLKEMFYGYDWTLLSENYLPATCSQPMIVSWMAFFKKLGVVEFLSIRPREMKLNREELAKSPWSEESLRWPTEKSEFIIHDYHCAELEGLITKNNTPSGDKYARQMKNLCSYLDKHWVSKCSKFCTACVNDKDGVPIKGIDASFSLLLKTAQWLPATETVTKPGVCGTVLQDKATVMKGPDGLYMKSKAVEKLLSDKVLYLDMELNCKAFYEFLGLKDSVSIETMMEFVTKWSERTTEGEPSSLITSLDHMINVYNFLEKELKRKEFQNLLQEKPVYFVPNTSSTLVYKTLQVLNGKMLNKSEIWLSDPTGLFEKHRQILEEFHSDICHKRTIQDFYKSKEEILELFKQEGKLDQHPKVEEYLELLCLLCSTCTQLDEKILADVIYIFSVLGEKLGKLPKTLQDEQTVNEARETLESTIKTTLQKKKVFPTSKQVWVSLNEVPFINDDIELSTMFADQPRVFFLDLECSATTKVKKAKQKSWKNSAKGRLEQKRIDELLEVCGIKKISEVVNVEPVPNMIEPCDDMQLYFSQIVPYIQQYLKARFPEVYQKLDPVKTRDVLKAAKFFQAGKLEVRYWFPLVTTEIFKIWEEKCKFSASEFYFHKDHLTELADIQKEAARYFSARDSNCFTALRSFLSELSNSISGVTMEGTDAVLSRHEVRNVEVDEEEKWSVEPPYVEPEVNEEILEETEIEQGPEVIDIPGDNVENAPFVTREWPAIPDFRKTGPQVAPWTRGKRAGEAAEYRRSVRDLPTNIRLVDDDSEDTGDKYKSGETDAQSNKDRTQSKDGSSESTETGTQNSGTGKRKFSYADEDGNVNKKQSTDRRSLSRDKEDNNREDQGSSKRRYDRPDNAYVREKRVIGEPIWKQKVTDYTVDELGTGKDIPVAKILNITDKEDDLDIGNWGELFVAQYLEKQKEVGQILDYKWRNEEAEAGFPFDFEVKIQDENGLHKDYIEVKSTQSNEKEVFQISVNQIKFAEEKAERYHIYRVYNAGNSDKVRLVRITNLDMRLSSKQVKLCMVI